MQIEEPAGTPNKFIVLRQEVLEDTRLSLAEKVVYARICTFDQYFEASEEAGKTLGLTKRQVEEAKRKLEKAGYIETIANTGRGKRYKAVYDLQKNVSQTYTKTYIRPTENCKSDLQKNVDIEGEIEKKENNVTKVTLAQEPVEYGDSSINEMMDLWEQIIGFKQKQSTANRRACYNLLRRKDCGKEKLGKIVQLLGEAQMDKYAPHEVKEIVGFASLQRNMEHLLMWARRKYGEQARKQSEVEI